MNTINEKLSRRPMEGQMKVLEEMSRLMRRGGLEFNAPRTSRRRRRLPNTGARTGRFARGAVIVYVPGPCVRRTSDARRWR